MQAEEKNASTIRRVVKIPGWAVEPLIYTMLFRAYGAPILRAWNAACNLE
jgi:hypothetical protein